MNKKYITNYSPKPDGNWDDLATIAKHANWNFHFQTNAKIAR
jgi:hypothetical protein